MEGRGVPEIKAAAMRDVRKGLPRLSYLESRWSDSRCCGGPNAKATDSKLFKYMQRCNLTLILDQWCACFGALPNC